MTFFRKPKKRKSVSHWSPALRIPSGPSEHDHESLNRKQPPSLKLGTHTCHSNNSASEHPTWMSCVFGQTNTVLNRQETWRDELLELSQKESKKEKDFLKRKANASKQKTGTCQWKNAPVQSNQQEIEGTKNGHISQRRKESKSADQPFWMRKASLKRHHMYMNSNKKGCRMTCISGVKLASTPRPSHRRLHFPTERVTEQKKRTDHKPQEEPKLWESVLFSATQTAT